jgi:hypothetical protein
MESNGARDGSNGRPRAKAIDGRRTQEISNRRRKLKESQKGAKKNKKQKTKVK